MLCMNALLITTLSKLHLVSEKYSCYLGCCSGNALKGAHYTIYTFVVRSLLYSNLFARMHLRYNKNRP